MAISKWQFRDLVRRVLKSINLWSPEAEELLLGTCAHESWFGTLLRQLENGPALGFFQIEKPTFDDLVNRYRARFPFIMDFQFEQMEWDIKASIIMARIKYYSCPGRIPDTLEGQARYWKQWYNTPLGAGTIEEYLANYRKYCQ